MKFEIVSQTDNKLYDRREVVARATDTGATPSRKQLLEELCKAVACPPDAVVIDRVRQRFGENACTITAKVYSKPELAARYEKAWKKARTEGKKAEAAAPAEAKK
jgi:ribosomal protein S24E